MKQKEISTFKVAGTYIGTIVGAGFASGQEVFQFFTVFGDMGLYGLLIVTLLFIFYGYVIMDLGMRLQSRSHLSIIRHAGGRIVGTIADIVITVFLFGGLTAMIAGSGALFKQQFNVSPLIGNGLMVLITVITVLSGFKGIINSISFVVPFLIIAAIGVSLVSIFIIPAETNPNAVMQQPMGFMRNWLWSAILYTSYNTVIAIAILGPLGAEVKNKQTIFKGAVVGGLGLGLGAMAIYLALKENWSLIVGLEVPMIDIAGLISPLVQSIYAVVLLAEIYTTAVGNLFGFTARIIRKQENAKYIIIGCSIFAFVASQFGFSNLVKYLYPIIGYAGTLILISLLYNRLKSGKS